MKTTWKSDPELKCSVVTSLVRHRAADQFKRGAYTRGGDAHFKGCALGCTLVPFGATRAEVNAIEDEVDADDTDRAWARAVAFRYGLPVWLARLDEAVFESTNSDEWPIELASAIPVGVPFRELNVRVFGELKRRIKAYGIENFAAVAVGDEDEWCPKEKWEPIGRDLLELLRGVEVEMPQPTAFERPALLAA